MDKIKNYAVIGNCRSMALISKSGSMDWLCWPQFDSDPIFAYLLDSKQGKWVIAPQGEFNIFRRYIDHTNIVETFFSNSQGKIILTDLMPVASEEDKREKLFPEDEIFRKVECVEGRLKINFELSFYGHAKFYSLNSTLGIRAHINKGIIILKSNVMLSCSANVIQRSITIKKGETLFFSLSFSREAPAVLPLLGDRPIKRSKKWWKEFSSLITYQGPYQDQVIRSALTLKLLCFAPSGAIVAAPTTSLPESVGSNLNWDYRFCWLRDASLTVHALMEIGLQSEAYAFTDWLIHATNLTRPKLNVLYDVYGRQPQKERVVPLEGYCHSLPVRMGNQAAQQNQLDLYGEVIFAVSRIFSDAEKIDHATQNMLKELVQYICKHWTEPDAGMWEVREQNDRFTHSMLLCWAGIHSALDLQKKNLLNGLDEQELNQILERIAQTIHVECWNKDLQSYTSTMRGTNVDSSLLLMPWYKFALYEDVRVRKTYDCILEKLRAENGLLYRNKNFKEGVFIACSLWAVEYLAGGGGSLHEAKSLFEEVLNHLNDVGLISEELDAVSGDFLGNFPLAFSHLGIIHAALAVSKRENQEKLKGL